MRCGQGEGILLRDRPERVSERESLGTLATPPRTPRARPLLLYTIRGHDGYASAFFSLFEYFLRPFGRCAYQLRAVE